MLPALGRRVFLTTGRQGLSAFAGLDRLWFLIRCVDPPAGPLPARREVLLARGPYTVAAELALMRRSRHRGPGHEEQRRVADRRASWPPPASLAFRW